jgi:hypothetical protein
MVAMVALASFEEVTGVGVFHTTLLAAAAHGCDRCISAGQSRRSMDSPRHCRHRGRAGHRPARSDERLGATFAGELIRVFSGHGPWPVLVCVYVLTLAFTEFVTNNAAAALAFLGYQTHLMVYGPGGYRFGDEVRIGLPPDFCAGS